MADPRAWFAITPLLAVASAGLLVAIAQGRLRECWASVKPRTTLDEALAIVAFLAAMVLLAAMGVAGFGGVW